MGMQVIIPEQVINELKKIAESKQKAHNKEASVLALRLLGKNKFKKINLGKGHVDKLIIRFSKENPETIIATLDREIKRRIKTNKLIIQGKKKLEII